MATADADRIGGAADTRAAVEAVPLWYHTLDLPDGIVTPGWFDLRGVVDRLPWPDVRGKRCLDVATYDGFFAFELERRGAREVVATDISDHDQWDWPERIRAQGPETLAAVAGPEKGAGFRVAHAALGSGVEKVELNVYDLSPERVGHFDVVVCGSLLLHLRDPLRALSAIRSVCRGSFLSSEEVRIGWSIVFPRRPILELDGVSDHMQWMVPNVSAHRRMVEAAGFELARTGPRFSIAFGPAYPRPGNEGRRAVRRRAAPLFGWDPEGVPHHAVLARS
jgi:tRNA (mo5U34)-methyltransferase